MTIRVLIAHAQKEEKCAEELAVALRDAGFEVAHQGTVLVGDSIPGETSRILGEGGPVVLCGTIRALGTRWARQVVQAARQNHGCRVFCVKMEEEADVESVSFDERVAEYWRDPSKALDDLISALRSAYPTDEAAVRLAGERTAEARYRRLALESCDIIDLANLPEADRHIATRKLELRRLYVPLHVGVEILAASELHDDSLRRLEQRRASRSWSDPRSPTLVQEQDGRATIGERLGKSRRLVVLGDPGAGKTTILRWIATAYLLRLKNDPDWRQLPAVETLPDENWLPVIVRCRELDGNPASVTLFDVLAHTFRKAEMSEEEVSSLLSVLRMKLVQGDALLLFDGLDEITNPGIRARFAQQLEQIHIAFPRAPIIATSRIVGYREMGYRIGRGFEHVTIADFTREEKDDFAQRWCELTELPERRAAAVRELVADVHSTDRIERLTGNPMLMTTMALVKRKVGRLPSRRADLYWEALQVLLNWRREVDEPIDHREAIPQLEYLAFEMCNRGVQQLREDEILLLLDRMRDEYGRMHDLRRRSSGDFLRLLERRTGILVEAGHVRHQSRVVPIFEFRHLTFQEYLAGLSLLEGIYPGRVKTDSLEHIVGKLSSQVSETEHDWRDSELVVQESWREAIRLAVANAPYDKADEVLRAVLIPAQAEDGKRTARARAVLAGLCLADEPKVSETVVEEVLNALSTVLQEYHTTGFHGSTFALAVGALSQSRWSSALQDVLLTTYFQSVPAQRSSVGAVLGTAVVSFHTTSNDHYNPSVAFDSSVVASDDNAAVSCFWASSVSHLNPEQSPWIISSALQAMDRSVPVIHAALECLFRLWNLPEILLSCELSDIERGIDRVWIDGGAKEIAIQITGKLKLDRLLPRLLSEFTSDNSQSPHLIVKVLGEMGNSRAVEPLLEKLTDKDSSIRSAAARSLGKIKDLRALGSLLARLHDPNEEVRSSAAWALGILGDTRALDALISRLSDDSEVVRSSAAIALRDLGDARAVDSLIAQLADESKQVRVSITDALGDLGDARAVEPLIALLSSDESEDVRCSAIDALGELKRVRAVPPLIACLTDQSEHVRSAAVQALDELKDVRAVDPLIALLQDADTWVRSNAATTLGTIGRKRVTERLIRELDSGDDDFRCAVISALGELKDVRAVEPLLTYLGDSSAHVRSSVADALGKLGDQRVIEPLLSRLNDESEDVQASVAVALGVLGEVRAAATLRAWLQADYSLIRGSAAEALGNLDDLEAFDLLCELLDDRYEQVRSSAAVALGKLGDSRAVIHIIARLGDGRVAVRSSAAKALGFLRDVRAVEPLLALLADEADVVRSAAAEALGEIKDERAVEPLLTQLEDKSLSVRRSTVLPLAKLADTRVFQPLVNALTDGDMWVRAMAAEALGDLQDTEAVEPLLAHVTDEAEVVREAVVIALGKLGDTRAVEPLLELLLDEDGWVRASAAESLGILGDPRALYELISILSDEDALVREQAAWALGNIGDVRAVERLISQLGDEDVFVRCSVADALGLLRDARAVDGLVIQLEDEDASVRFWAAMALGNLWEPEVELATAESEDGLALVSFIATPASANVGISSAMQPLLSRLDDSDTQVRKAALYALTLGWSDRLGAVLLSQDLTGEWPFRDPSDPITVEHLKVVQQTLGMDESDVCDRYRALANQFGLTIQFD